MIEATRLFPSFHKISFLSWEAHSITSEAAELTTCTIHGALRNLHAASSITLVKHRFETKTRPMEEINKEFNRSRCELCRVRSEMQFVHDYESRRAKRADTGRVHLYIGNSKLCCYLLLVYSPPLRSLWLSMLSWEDPSSVINSDHFDGERDDPSLRRNPSRRGSKKRWGMSDRLWKEKSDVPNVPSGPRQHSMFPLRRPYYRARRLRWLWSLNGRYRCGRGK